MVKQIGAHEVSIALVMLRGKPYILVQIHGSDLGEVQLARLVFGNQLPVGTHGAAAGGKAQYAVGFQIDLSGNDVCGLTAYILIILGANQSHFVYFPFHDVRGTRSIRSYCSIFSLFCTVFLYRIVHSGKSIRFFCSS